jgi:hypothetical protein
MAIRAVTGHPSAQHHEFLRREMVSNLRLYWLLGRSARQGLRQFSTLRAEIDELARTDADRAKTIAGFAELSAHEATRPKPHPELLKLSVTGLQESVQEFEKTHPRLVEIVGSLSTILSNIGF